MKVTDAMVAKAREATDVWVPDHSMREMLEAVLAMPEVRAALLREIAEELSVAPNESEDLRTEPQEIGARVIDGDDDVWTKTELGWLFREHGLPAPWSDVRKYKPLARLP